MFTFQKHILKKFGAINLPSNQALISVEFTSGLVIPVGGGFFSGYLHGVDSPIEALYKLVSTAPRWLFHSGEVLLC